MQRIGVIKMMRPVAPPPTALTTHTPPYPLKHAHGYVSDTVSVLATISRRVRFTVSTGWRPFLTIDT